MQNYRDRKYVSGSRTGAEEILNYKGVQRNLGDRSAGALSISWYLQRKIASTTAAWTVGTASEFKRAHPFVAAAHSGRIDCR